MCRGELSFFLVGPPGSDPGFDGKKLPTEGFIVWDGTWAAHHGPEIWHRADEFLPERFIVIDREDPLFPPTNGWRPFVSGPRNCIGQHLLVLEVKNEIRSKKQLTLRKRRQYGEIVAIRVRT
ncbi:hypothetical protein NXS19_007592 [Fusarium pseudograminearum]|nr:hypothetical protein NXS19_007592 [Fusarium pseudograminearum]